METEAQRRGVLICGTMQSKWVTRGILWDGALGTLGWGADSYHTTCPHWEKPTYRSRTGSGMEARDSPGMLVGLVSQKEMSMNPCSGEAQSA